METERATVSNPEFNLIQRMISTAGFAAQNDDGLEVSNNLEASDLLIAALFVRFAQVPGDMCSSNAP